MRHAGTATDYLNLMQLLDALMTERHVATVAVNAGGTGWTVGDTFTFDETGATVEHSLSATGIVTSVSGGVITGVKVLNGGAYSVDPTTTTGNSITGAGSGATMNITLANSGWTQDLNATVDTTENNCIWHGEGGGSDSIYVGVKSYRDTGAGTYFGWEIGGFTGYASSTNFEDQPGFSGVGGIGANMKCYVPLASSAATNIEYWFYISTYRVCGVLKNGTTYQSFHMGWLNRFSTAAQYPYPMFIAGMTTDGSRLYNASDNGEGGMTCPISTASGTGGPACIRDNNGTWRTVENGYKSGSSVNHNYQIIVLPKGETTSTYYDEKDNFMGASGQFTQSSFGIFEPGDGAAVGLLIPTEAGADDITMRYPCTVVMFNPSKMIIGEIDGVFSITAQGGLSSEDTLTDSGGDVFEVFQDGNRTDTHNYLAILRS